jgi:hypothetical protein
MPFINNYNGAMKIVKDIRNGSCKGKCKTIWMRTIKYALKSKTNPLGLNKKQYETIHEKLKMDSVHTRTTLNKKRKSPPYPANEHCHEQMKGNDGKLYISKPNKQNICSWKRI